MGAARCGRARAQAAAGAGAERLGPGAHHALQAEEGEGAAGGRASCGDVPRACGPLAAPSPSPSILAAAFLRRGRWAGARAGLRPAGGGGARGGAGGAPGAGGRRRRARGAAVPPHTLIPTPSSTPPHPAEMPSVGEVRCPGRGLGTGRGVPFLGEEVQRRRGAAVTGRAGRTFRFFGLSGVSEVGQKHHKARRRQREGWRG